VTEFKKFTATGDFGTLPLGACSPCELAYGYLMQLLTDREVRLIAAVLAAVVVGFGIKTWRANAAIEPALAVSPAR
jgi:hypothetical protein